MFCPKCGSEIAEGSAFCGKCGAPVNAQAAGAAPAGSAQGAASGGAGAGAPVPKRSGAKIGAIAAVVVVAVVLVAGFATNWFGLAGVQPKEAVEIPAASQGADGQQDANAADGQGDGVGESADGAQGDSQDAGGAAVKSAVEAYTWDELSQISAEIGGAGDEAAAIEVAKRYNLCTPEGKLDGTQVKAVALADGTQTTGQILGCAHDDKTSGGKAGITFIFGDCVGQEPMNEEGTNEGGWEASPMRTYLNGTWRAQLPEDLDAVIVPVDKLTNNEGETKSAASVTSTSDSLWLPSVVELVGPIGDVYFGEEDRYRPVGDILNAEGSVYKLYRDAGVDTSGDNAILVKSGEGVSSYDGPSAPWWERSAYSPFYRKNFAVDTLGNALYATESDGTCCFAPGFCI